MPRLRSELATVRISVSAKSGEKLEGIRASTALIRQGHIRLHSLKLKKETNFFFLQMPPGRHPLFVSATDFYESAQFVDFVKGINPLISIILEPMHSPAFRSFMKLSRHVRAVFEKSAAAMEIGSGKEVYEGLPRGRRAAALNILAKMEDTSVFASSGPRVIEAVEHIYAFRRDRIYAILNQDLLEVIDRSLREGRSRFKPASGALHKGFPSGSYKTIEENKKGNLQLSFDSRNKKKIRVDADIDMYADFFRHFFGEVFWNTLADVRTNPFKVYGLLVQDGILPEYSLVP